MLEASENEVVDENMQITPYLLQTGGHVYEHGKVTGISLHEDGSILKPLMPPPRGDRELNFYRSVFSEHDEPVTLKLCSFIPQFRGLFQTSIQGQTATFLKLENLTSKFKKPCIMDVKIGFRTYDPESTTEKIERAQKKYLTTSKLGFCIPGIKVCDSTSGEYKEYDKVYGKSLTTETIKNALICYLGGHDKLNAKALQSFLHQLEVIRKWFLGQHKYAFYSSSLLCIYESAFVKSSSESGVQSKNYATVHSNAVQCNAGRNSCSPSKNSTAGVNKSTKYDNCTDVICDTKDIDGVDGHDVLTDIRMIDFAHVFQSSELDSNYLGGLNNLIQMLSAIENEFAQ